LGKHKNKFNASLEAAKYIKRHKLSLTVEQLLAKWELLRLEGLRKGNKYHDTREINSIHFEDAIECGNYSLDLSGLKDGIYSELILYSDKYRIAGKADWIRKKGNKIFIRDYKTNKKAITKNNYGKFMLYPFHNIPDAVYYHYSLQLNIYGFLLYEFGYDIEGLEIYHKRFLDDEDVPDWALKESWQSEEQLRKPIIINPKFRPDIIKQCLDNVA